MSATDNLPAPVAVPALNGANVLDVLRAGIADMDGIRQELADAGDLDSLAHGLHALRRLKRDLAMLESAVEADVAKLMPQPTVEFDGFVAQRRRGTDRKAWQSEQLLDQVLLRAAHDPETGEVIDDPYLLRDRVSELVRMTLPVVPSTGWRVTGLKALGLDPEDWCESSPGRTSVQLHEGDQS